MQPARTSGTKKKEDPFDRIPLPRCIIGLGNPGDEYRHTFHNAGALALRELLARLAPLPRAKETKLFRYWKIGALVVVEPHTFMNESGTAAARILALFRIPPEHLLVMHDESDLPLGSFRVSFGRGPAGHNGVRSIIETLKTDEFARLRIGVRTGAGKAKTFVLRNMSAESEKKLHSVISDAIVKLTEKFVP